MRLLIFRLCRKVVLCMNKIIPHLWFDKEAKEAALFYTGLLEDSAILGNVIIENTPSGDSEIVTFRLESIAFESISAGPYFKFNPSISLMVYCKTEEELKRLWGELKKDGAELMPLGEYHFSNLYSWVEDKYGLSWQLFYNQGQEFHQKIVPSMLFSSGVCGQAKDALDFYQRVFKDSKLNTISYYGKGDAPNKNALVNYSSLSIHDFEIVLMDNAMEADFTFNEAFSLIIRCKDQEEIDYYWDKLSADPEAEACGWLKDKFGVSWQIVPDTMEELLFGGTKEELQRVTEAFLKMKKFELSELEKAKIG